MGGSNIYGKFNYIIIIIFYGGSSLQDSSIVVIQTIKPCPKPDCTQKTLIGEKPNNGIMYMNNTRPLMTKPFNLMMVVHNWHKGMNNQKIVNSTRKLLIRLQVIKPWCTTPKTQEEFPIIHSTFSISSINHSHHPWLWWIQTSRPI